MEISNWKFVKITAMETAYSRGDKWLDEGWIFGEGGAGFERIVLACPRSILKEAVDRMARAFE
ncbi:hypothetical protein [uncultured Fretibacterium sp.]|uniref:hypothetical protein n=1 Tax=uncultured Fretibacterium sp. TaxID=1678694 RepID=UPI0026091D7D|nr:hypothetical protein [uncultured Fretibacterium sp.]